MTSYTQLSVKRIAGGVGVHALDGDPLPELDLGFRIEDPVFCQEVLSMSSGVKKPKQLWMD